LKGWYGEVTTRRPKMPDDRTQQLYSVSEAAVQLKLGRSTVGELIRGGELDAHRLGRGKGVYRITQKAINDYLAATKIKKMDRSSVLSKEKLRRAGR